MQSTKSQLTRPLRQPSHQEPDEPTRAPGGSSLPSSRPCPASWRAGTRPAQGLAGQDGSQAPSQAKAVIVPAPGPLACPRRRRQRTQPAPLGCVLSPASASGDDSLSSLTYFEEGPPATPRRPGGRRDRSPARPSPGSQGRRRGGRCRCAAGHSRTRGMQRRSHPLAAGSCQTPSRDRRSPPAPRLRHGTPRTRAQGRAVSALDRNPLASSPG